MVLSLSGKVKKRLLLEIRSPLNQTYFFFLDGRKEPKDSHLSPFTTDVTAICQASGL